MEVLSLLIIFLVSISTVLLIITDWRTNFEESIREDYGINRTWYVPVVASIFLYGSSIVTADTIASVFIDRIDIIVLILSFGLLSEGMRGYRWFR